MTTEEQIRRRFDRGCVRYGLLADGDRILVALSGGKDSLMLCRLLSERSRIWRPHFTVEAAHVVMDNIPYETDVDFLSGFCQQLGIRLHVLHASFDSSTDQRHSPCFLCAWNRRHALFEFAARQGFNKVALGHHQDDILVTWLMNMTYEGSVGTMLPLLQLDHFAVTIIRPLCLVHEAWIREVAASLGFVRQKRPCPFEQVTRRSDMEAVFRQLEVLNPEARYSLWQAMEKAQRVDK